MMRKAIARRLTESKQTVPHFYLSIDVDADPLNALREQINADLGGDRRRGGEAGQVSFNDLLVKACAIALVRVPECNAQFTPDAILVHQRVDISVAVARPRGPRHAGGARRRSQAGARHRGRSARARRASQGEEAAARGDGERHVLDLEPRHGTGIDNFGAVINRPRERSSPSARSVAAVVRGEQIVPGRRLSMTLSPAIIASSTARSARPSARSCASSRSTRRQILIG